jgi:ABC-type sugar transport system ATPase subunit
MACVQRQQVRQSCDGKPAVIHGINREVSHGEFAVFAGPSGCELRGKVRTGNKVD